MTEFATKTGLGGGGHLFSLKTLLYFWSYLPLSDENFTRLNLNISEASWPILISFCVASLGGGKAA